MYINAYLYIYVIFAHFENWIWKSFVDSCLETKLSEALATKRQIPYKDRILFIEFAKVSLLFFVVRWVCRSLLVFVVLLLSLDSKTTVWDASKKLQLDECWRATVTQCLTNALSSSHHGNGKNRSRLDEAKELFPLVLKNVTDMKKVARDAASHGGCEPSKKKENRGNKCVQLV